MSQTPTSNLKNVFLVGGEGFTAEEIVRKLLQQESVRVKVGLRPNTSLSLPENEKLSTVPIDPLDDSSITPSLLQGIDTVIVTNWSAGHPTNPLEVFGLKPFGPTHPWTQQRAMELLCPAATEAGVQRVIFLSWIGAVRPWTMRSIIANTFQSFVVGFNWEAEKVLHDSSLNYTVVRVGPEGGTLGTNLLELTVPRIGQGDRFQGQTSPETASSIVLGCVARDNCFRATMEAIDGAPATPENTEPAWASIKSDYDARGNLRKPWPSPVHPMPFLIIVCGAAAFAFGRFIRLKTGMTRSLGVRRPRFGRRRA